MISVTSDMLTHVKLIDEQHHELFNRINAVESMGAAPDEKKKTEETLDFLGSYIVKHFEEEEEIQLETGYPQHRWHHEMHSWYIAEYHKLRKEYNENGFSEQFSHLLNESIMKWFVRHVKHVDVELGKYVRAHLK
ncbi:MAG: hemerythrin family protein [Oscillospiraceae bacterium]|nr:hemerythrin family protein [Oscillospiraceae bacterium]